MKDERRREQETAGNKPLVPTGPRRRSTVRRVATRVAGWAFLGLGVLGLFLPILQGLLFLAIGLSLLSHEYHWVRRLMEWLRARYPAFSRALDQAQSRVARLGHRIRRIF